MSIGRRRILSASSVAMTGTLVAFVGAAAAETVDVGGVSVDCDSISADVRGAIPSCSAGWSAVPTVVVDGVAVSCEAIDGAVAGTLPECVAPAAGLYSPVEPVEVQAGAQAAAGSSGRPTASAGGPAAGGPSSPGGGDPLGIPGGDGPGIDALVGVSVALGGGPDLLDESLLGGDAAAVTAGVGLSSRPGGTSSADADDPAIGVAVAGEDGAGAGDVVGLSIESGERSGTGGLVGAAIAGGRDSGRGGLLSVGALNEDETLRLALGETGLVDLGRSDPDRSGVRGTDDGARSRVAARGAAAQAEALSVDVDREPGAASASGRASVLGGVLDAVARTDREARLSARTSADRRDDDRGSGSRDRSSGSSRDTGSSDRGSGRSGSDDRDRSGGRDSDRSGDDRSGSGRDVRDTVRDTAREAVGAVRDILSR